MNDTGEGRPDSDTPIGESDPQQGHDLNERAPGHRNSEQRRDEESLPQDVIGRPRHHEEPDPAGQGRDPAH